MCSEASAAGPTNGVCGAGVFFAAASIASARLASLRPPSMQTSGCSTPIDGALA